MNAPRIRGIWNLLECVCVLMFVLCRKLRLIIVLEERKKAKLQLHRAFCILELCDLTFVSWDILMNHKRNHSSWASMGKKDELNINKTGSLKQFSQLLSLFLMLNNQYTNQIMISICSINY